MNLTAFFCEFLQIVFCVSFTHVCWAEVLGSLRMHGTYAALTMDVAFGRRMPSRYCFLQHPTRTGGAAIANQFSPYTTATITISTTMIVIIIIDRVTHVHGMAIYLNFIL